MGKGQWRCSPRKMLRIWKLTSPGQQDILRDLGFGFIKFLSFIAFKSEIILFIVKNFRSSRASVTIQRGVDIKLTEDHIQRIYGLPGGSLISDYIKNPVEDVKTWAKIGLGAVKKVQLSDVEDRLLLEDDDETWFTLFVLYTLGNLFKPVSSLSVKLNIMGMFYKKDPPEFKEFNWCQHLIQTTKESGIWSKNYVEADVNMLTMFLLDMVGGPGKRVPSIRPTARYWTNKRLKVRWQFFKNMGGISHGVVREWNSETDLVVGIEDTREEEGPFIRRVPRRLSRRKLGEKVTDNVRGEGKSAKEGAE